jgi:hypothetical protein
MKSRTTRKFWRMFEALPKDIQDHARRAYRQFHADPSYPALAFKRVNNSEPIYSVRIGINYRAAGLLEGDTVTWFWIGPHDEYERLLRG